MTFDLKRKHYASTYTIGELFINGEFFCYTLEDQVRKPGEPKVNGETAIPAGRYVIKMTYSPRFKRLYPEVMNVPGFEGIRFGHPGNTAKDTEGCILVGFEYGEGYIGESARASAELQAKFNEAPDATHLLVIS